ncbi:hypothetical protein TL16_g09519 [Triparma laevis f. inornata]|uniref:NAD-dependent epimerase/dehydratase domain-containing protein n=1 Tax=Triparma laevis f. inornata TaxID=1714386 RepID=A0A9W7B3J2_9STRA|nr:hypothetical protein TL16_g09519 [Triparma laevis f. inornata]
MIRSKNFFILLSLLLTSVSCTSDISPILIIGASGAIGTQLTKKLLDEGHQVVAGLRMTAMPDDLANHPNLTSVFGVDCRNSTSIDLLFSSHPVKTVWNLAAPLSVETSSSPTLAYDTVVTGMSRILTSMSTHNVKTILFSDSIGSYGSTSPRLHATARWLTENPTQDPGSDYGVLHRDESWGAGTTEYVLDAIKTSKENIYTYISTVPLHTYLPMIWRSDLIEGLYRLTVAEEGDLKEPENGYAISGLSFTADEVLKVIKSKVDSFGYIYNEKDVEHPAEIFARLWPDSLSGVEAERDLKGFKAKVVDLEVIVDLLLGVKTETEGGETLKEEL